MTESGKKNGTILAFLRARLDEDEAAAKAATAGPWWNESGTIHAPLDNGQVGAACHPADCQGANTADPGADAEHIAEHDPARVLREVESKRRIVDIHAIAGPDTWNPRYCIKCLTTERIADSSACMTVRLLALPYSDHPDYREEWSV